MTQTKEAIDEKVVLSEDTAEDDGLMHYVHEQCHSPESPFVVAWCGIALDWEEKRPGEEFNKSPECQGCVASMKCPNCGLHKMPGSRRK